MGVRPVVGNAMPVEDLMLLAEGQHCVFTFAQARKCGIARATIHRKARDGVWNRVGRGVFMVAGAVPTPFTELAVAILEISGTAVAARWSACALHGIGEPPSPPQVNVHESQRIRKAKPRVDVRGTFVLSDEDVTVRRGLPVTSLERTLVDLAGVTTRTRLADVLDTALRMRLSTIERIRGRAEALRARGRAGPALLLELLFERSGSGSTTTESLLEDRWERIARQVPGFVWRRQVEMHVGGVIARVDFVCDEHRIIIETDGWSSHSSKEAFQRDRSRRTALTASGYLVLVFTWEDVTHRPDWVAEQITKAVSERSRRSA